MSISQLYPAEGPSLNLNFAGSRTLDPRITFTRTQTTSNGSTYTGRDGLIKYAGPDEPRFDHRYVSGDIESLGLLIEEQRTNSINNNTMVGALVGTPGTPPTSWGIGTNNAELTHSIVGVGVESGISYIDVRVSGTVTASRACDIQQAPDITASNGQTWTHSVYLRQVGGSQTNITDIRIQGNVYSSTAYLTTPWFHAVPVTTESLITQRRVFTATLVGETITRVRPFIKITTASSGAVDFTLRIGMPQLELGAFATSVIPTEGSTKTRTKDVAYIDGTNFTEWYNPSESTFFTTFRQIYNSSATVPARTPHVLQAGNATTVNDNYTIRGGESNLYWTALIRSASPSSLQFPGFNPYPYLNSSTQYKAALSVNSSLISVSLNGLLTADNANTTTVNHTTPFNKLFIGSGTGGGPPYELSGHLAQIIYYPFRVSNSQLQNLTK